MRYFIEFDYLGTHYHGWQRQPNGITVQEEVEKGLRSITGQETALVGCGRTDAGVHARNYIAHFDGHILDRNGFLEQLNIRTPADISINQLYKVNQEAHARYDANFRRYEYELSYEKEIFFHQSRYHYPYTKKPDLAILKDLTGLFLGEHDFYAFHKLGSDVKHTNCTIAEFDWRATPNGLILSVAANRFLRGMVRLLVGASINTGLGKVSLHQIRAALHHQVQLPINLSVPAEGLSLIEIRYPYPLIALD